MDTSVTSKLTLEQKQAIMLHINERLYQKGEIQKAMYEEAKCKILLTR